MYFTAQLFLYLPYINNPLNDSFNFQGSPVFPNYQNFEARRYSMFADVASQKVYNYWNSIGDLLATFFPNQMNQKRIYFGTAIDKIPTQFQNSSNYIWLKDFKKNQYAQLNLIRNQVVHYTTTDTEYRHQHLEIIYDKPAIISLQQNREGLADYYKEHLKLGNEGYEKTLLLLLEEINQVLYTQTTNPNP